MGRFAENLQRQIAELRLGDLVTLAGALPQDCVLERLSACDIFALASTTDENGASDVFPTVILEAMASARPVVSTMLAGIPESVVDKETGLLVPAGESWLFADALETLCRDPDLRARYGAAGRTRVEEHFKVETTVQPLIATAGKKPAAPLATDCRRSARATHRLPDRSTGRTTASSRWRRNWWRSRNERSEVCRPSSASSTTDQRLTAQQKTASAAARISAGRDGDRGRMAGEPRAGPRAGRQSCQRIASGAGRTLFAAGPFRRHFAADVSPAKDLPRPRDQLARA